MQNPERKGSKLQIRQTGNLRRGRLSVPNARYFLTLNTKNRADGLSNPNLLEPIRDALRQAHRSGDIELYCATIMPDHLHLLFTLGERLILSRVVGKFKSATKRSLKTVDVEWQANFFDHRLRPDVPLEAFAKYIYLNPYRKDLIPLEAIWHGWIINRGYQPEFITYLRESSYPPKEWLSHSQSAEQLIEATLHIDGENTP